MHLRTNLTAAFLVVLGLIAELVAAAPATSEPSTRRRFEFSEPQMGTTMRIVFYAADAATANRAARAAFDRVAELNRILTDYEASSELSKLSATAPSDKGVAVSADLWNVLSQSQHWATESGGAFDPTVGPLIRLWRRARRQQELPAADDLAAARKAVGFRFLKLDSERRTVQLTQPNMRLDVGGIGKGFAADEALAVLRKAGFAQSMVALSGDMALGEAPPDQKGWRIGVGSPKPVIDKSDQSMAPLALSNCGVSTSGDKFQFVVIGGRRYSHILDARTGEPLSRPSSVTTVAPTATTADACATAISVLGPKAGLEFAKKVKGLEVQITTARDDKSDAVDTVRSSGFEQLLTPKAK